MRGDIMVLVVLVLTLAVIAALLYRLLLSRSRRLQRGVFGAWPVPSVSLEAIDPIFRLTELGPTRDAEVAMVGRGSLYVIGATTDSEMWILGALAKRARLLFEFGTCTGRTAYVWARNSPAHARIVTLTLRAEDQSSYGRSVDDGQLDSATALAESRFDSFVYSGTDVEAKVEQLYGDSKTADVSKWEEQCDVVFVDGSHAYSYVLSDSRKALSLVSPGGLVLWHDYGGPHHAVGVFRALNELVKELPIVHIAGTHLAAYRRPL